MHDLTGKTVLVTGASGGIGAVTVRALGAAGANVIAHFGHNRAGAEAAVADLPAGRSLVLGADLSVRGASRALWRDAVAWHGRVDVLVANAAVQAMTPFDGTDDEWDDGWELAFRVNVFEQTSLAREALRHWLETGGGSLVSLSSWAAQRGSALTNVSAYAASKAALKNFTQTIARNYGGQGVLAYVVAPGIVHTSMSEVSAAARGGIDKVNAMLPLGEMVPPSEVADLIVFLASGSCRHLTGATIDLNGASNIR